MATKAKGTELEITQQISCEVPGFEQVQITFDLLATPDQVDNFVRSMGGKGSHAGLVLAVDGWPKDEYGPDPWDTKRAPGVWFAWVSRRGWATAMKAYLDDPNF